ncbi:hypothetical protein C8Q70DRAFT_935553 [Cubamyces menziesii]|nr:hypothetical protein C8Q70DRAFT_935553 [Cubamyces menziesii]
MVAIRTYAFSVLLLHVLSAVVTPQWSTVSPVPNSPSLDPLNASQPMQSTNILVTRGTMTIRAAKSATNQSRRFGGLSGSVRMRDPGAMGRVPRQETRIQRTKVRRPLQQESTSASGVPPQTMSLRDGHMPWRQSVITEVEHLGDDCNKKQEKVYIDGSNKTSEFYQDDNESATDISAG